MSTQETFIAFGCHHPKENPTFVHKVLEDLFHPSDRIDLRYLFYRNINYNPSSSESNYRKFLISWASYQEMMHKNVRLYNTGDDKDLLNVVSMFILFPFPNNIIPSEYVELMKSFEERKIEIFDVSKYYDHKIELSSQAAILNSANSILFGTSNSLYANAGSLLYGGSAGGAGSFGSGGGAGSFGSAGGAGGTSNAPVTNGYANPEIKVIPENTQNEKSKSADDWVKFGKRMGIDGMDHFKKWFINT